METVLAHHWLVGMRGGEKVLEQFCLLFPDAPIYTLVARPQRLSPLLRSHQLRVSWFGHLPGAVHLYKHALPLFPLIIGTHRIREKASLVLSSDASMIKGVSVPRGTPHVCYCHSPPRYLWDQQEAYAQIAGAGMKLFRLLTPSLRQWDRKAAQKVDYFIANSRFVQDRIRSAYGRESTVIHPPVALKDFTSVNTPEDFYLIVSQLVPYKRIDVAVAAFNQLGKRLVIIGEGSELTRLQKMASANVEFLGSQPFSVLRDHYARCRAFIFPGIEDFGITPLEAQASGRPVVAFKAGGVLETVVDGKTGVFFDRLDAESLTEAVTRFESQNWESAACRAHAATFGEERFRRQISAFLGERGLPLGQSQQ